ncbi:MAG: glycosyltransferase [Flavobacteriales bacterium CG_4_9_14_3_um_filter_32_8]|nr:MAG: glycosyltransferase [Flavobacteriales bacterium CG_4_9_14_3_um_filter_32_8]
MKLSIIIVNYNVRHFLAQCLNSVVKATANISAEVFVVDNNSLDDSVKMVRENFPNVNVIHNTKNVGFSKANNQAIELAKGEYILLLNPDTVVEEDTFEKCIQFMDAHPEGGGLGVKMIDGNGNFLPESKRGLPTPSVSFYKIFGLSKLFKKSKIFSKYHLGYLNEDEINEVEVLSGAFMWMRKSVLDKVGYLDEAFFMYGEDIDLSYRILLGGYKNYYFPEAKIIHYKGESTKKGNINYVFIFYNAMIIFSKKHFAKKAKAFSFFISIAIYLRAFLAILFRFIAKLKLLITDALLITITLSILNYLKPFFGFPNQIAFANNYEVLNVVAVFGSFLIGLLISGGYSKEVSIKKTLLGLLIGSVTFFLLNFAFPEPASFSNKYLISIIGVIIVIIPVNRLLLDFFDYIKLRKEQIKTTIIVGNDDFVNKIKEDIKKKQSSVKILSLKSNNVVIGEDAKKFIGKLNQLPDIIDIYTINEVIFSSNDVRYKDIINEMNLSLNKYVDYKISLDSNLIIGSQKIEKYT